MPLPLLNFDSLRVAVPDGRSLFSLFTILTNQDFRLP